MSYYIRFNLKSYIITFVNPFIDLNTVFMLKSFLNYFGNNTIKYINMKNCLDFRSTYLLGDTLTHIRNFFVNVVVFVSTNLRLEMPLFNSKFKVMQNFKNFIFISFGLNVNFSILPVINFGSTPTIFKKFITGKFIKSKILIDCSYFSAFVVNSVFFYLNESVLFFVSNFFNKNFEASNSLDFVKQYFFKTVKLCLISNNLGWLSCAELGVTDNSIFPINNNLNYSLNCNIDICTGITIFQGCFGNYLNKYSNYSLVIPVPTYMEMSAFYLNLEGFIRRSNIAIKFDNLKNDIDILKCLNSLLMLFFKFNYSVLDDFLKITKIFKKLEYSADSVKKFFIFYVNNTMHLKLFFIRKPVITK